MRNNKKILTYKMQKYKAEERLKRNAMDIITENLHCMDAVGRERATLCKFIVCILVDINGETENCSVRENLKKKTILKNMQIVLNARERNTKHIPAGMLMNQNKIPKVLNSTITIRVLSLIK